LHRPGLRFLFGRKDPAFPIRGLIAQHSRGQFYPGSIPRSVFVDAGYKLFSWGLYGAYDVEYFKTGHQKPLEKKLSR
jgi:hypothetical protein